MMMIMEISWAELTPYWTLVYTLWEGNSLLLKNDYNACSSPKDMDETCPEMLENGAEVNVKNVNQPQRFQASQ